MIIELAISRLKSIMERKGYTFFERGAYNLNIIGFRSETRIANRFDDRLVNVFKNEEGEWKWNDYPITTDAGTYWLKNPMIDEKGCALLVPNQYRGVYKIDKHNGKYDALCQRLGDVEVYRDNNRDMVLDFDPTTTDTGRFGINIHKSNPHRESKRVDKWSAGCQVFQSNLDFDVFMEDCKKASKIWGNKFSYTLLTYKDLRI